MGQYLLGRSGLILASEMSCRNINFSGVVILQKLLRDEGCRCVLVNTEKPATGVREGAQR